jgi:hypothetical protein
MNFSSSIFKNTRLLIAKDREFICGMGLEDGGNG